MKLPWHIKDIIDLEYFLQKDEDTDDGAVSRRDREIFLKQVLPSLPSDAVPGKSDRRKAIRLWLDERRKLETASSGKMVALPGTLFHDILSPLMVILLLAGLFFGLVSAFATLQYRGSEPINVSTYLGIFVLLQILLIVILVFWRFLGRFLRSFRHLSVLQSILGNLLARFFKRSARRALGSLSQDHRNHLSAVSGAVKGNNQIYGKALFWPAFVGSQIFGIGFNIGALGGTLTKVMGSDLAFGWQSTLQISSQAVHEGVRMLAAPWSSLVSPSIAHPTLEQIHGSRMVLKDGIYSLATPDLVSWWPFLVLALCCYGLLPRVILAITGIIAQKRSLSRLTLDHASCTRLWRRMTTPHLQTEGERLSPLDPPPIHSSGKNGVLTPIATAEKREDPAYVLIPEDISRNLWAETLNPLVKRLQAPVSPQQISVSLDFETDKEALMAQICPGGAPLQATIAFLQEAWQPPIAETLSYFKDLRRLLGTRAPLDIVLIGKTTSEGGLLPVPDGDMRLWVQALTSLGDPYIQIARHGDAP